MCYIVKGWYRFNHPETLRNVRYIRKLPDKDQLFNIIGWCDRFENYLKRVKILNLTVKPIYSSFIKYGPLGPLSMKCLNVTESQTKF